MKRRLVSSTLLALLCGDPCEAFAYHGFDGLEGDVVAKIAAWVMAIPAD